MDDRQALINFTRHMTKIYGSDYMEHWTEEDAETFDILTKRVRKAMDTPTPKNWESSAYLRRVLGINTTPDKEETTRKKRWAEWAEKYGSGVVGTLREERLYDGVQPKKRKIKSEPVVAAPKINPDDVDSSSIFAYLMSN